MKKILVTGGAGYIGSVTTELLLDLGYNVSIFDNFSRGHLDAVDKRALLFKGDLQKKEDIEKAIVSFKPDAVMHFAAYALVGESMEKPEIYFNNNVIGGINLINAMLKTNTRKIVFSSTCATYGEPEKIPISEDSLQKPTNPYGESKLILEKILCWHQKINNFEPVFLRYFNACGATKKFGEDHTPETHLIPCILKVASGEKEELLIYGNDYPTKDGTCIRDYIHIIDLANAHILALKDGITGAFNLGSESGFSVKQIVDAAKEITKKNIKIKIAQRRLGDPPCLIANAAKAKKILGWEQKNSDIKIIINDAWHWLINHPKGYDK